MQRQFWTVKWDSQKSVDTVAKWFPLLISFLKTPCFRSNCSELHRFLARTSSKSYPQSTKYHTDVAPCDASRFVLLGLIMRTSAIFLPGVAKHMSQTFAAKSMIKLTPLENCGNVPAIKSSDIIGDIDTMPLWLGNWCWQAVRFRDQTTQCQAVSYTGKLGPTVITGQFVVHDQDAKPKQVSKPVLKSNRLRSESRCTKETWFWHAPRWWGCYAEICQSLCGWSSWRHKLEACPLTSCDLMAI